MEMAISDKLRKFVLKIFNINEYQTQYFSIDRRYNYQSNAFKNKLWYDGDAYELSQFYHQAGENNNSFWSSSSSRGQEIRKIHSGIPSLIVDSLTNITGGDLESIHFIDENKDELWKTLETDTDFRNRLIELTKTALIVGDGAVKFCYDLDNSKTPYIEIVEGQNVDYVYSRNQLKEVKFYTQYTVSSVDYILEETYGYGYIRYKLFKGENEVSLKSILQTSDLVDVEFDDSILLAVPFKFFNSTKYDKRGKSIYEGKIDAFDALDETISQWIDALRAGRTKTYIPQSLIPMDMEGGYLLRPNAFDNRFIQVADSMTENGSSQITTIQPDIKTDAYIQTYITVLDMALQGIISPSTLGIDNKKLDNAEATREKEKATLYSREAILNALNTITKKMVQCVFDTVSIMYGTEREEIDVEVNFGGYANPSFESVVEVMSNPNSPMSIEARVEEIWGDTKTDEWKAEEVKRIKQERGIVELDEPSSYADLTEADDNE